MELDFDWTTPLKLYEENDGDVDLNCSPHDMMDCSSPESPCRDQERKPELSDKDSPSVAMKERKRCAANERCQGGCSFARSHPFLTKITL